MADTTELVPLPRVPLGDGVEAVADWVQANLDPVLDGFSTVVGAVIDGFTDLLLLAPPLVAVVLLALLGTALRSVRFGLLSLVALLLVASMGLWAAAMQTLALILVATLVAAAVGVPLGILAARSDRVSSAFKPVLDFMQTMPAFVYLVPAVIFFSIGVVPGFVSTIVFALPPGVRLTELGIRQVDGEIVEAGTAFGGSRRQILRGIQLPLALPTIMAGINQVIMLALSMAVIAGIVGAPGLGQEVVSAISRLDIGLGFEAGLSVVILAIFLDRVTASLGSSAPRDRLARARSLLGRGSTSTDSRQEAGDDDDAEVHRSGARRGLAQVP